MAKTDLIHQLSNWSVLVHIKTRELIVLPQELSGEDDDFDFDLEEQSSVGSDMTTEEVHL